MLKVYLIIVSMAVLIVCESFADSKQITHDIDLILKYHNISKTSHYIETNKSKENISEINFFAIGIIKLYQTVISSQDVPACNFTPSCSRFALDAIHKGGFVKGLLLGTDRLLRCHYFSVKFYHDSYGFTLENDIYKLNDPVERYLHFEKNK